MKCPNCGAELTNYCCEYCDSDFMELKPAPEQTTHVVINNYFDSDAVENAQSHAREQVPEHTVYVNGEYVSSKSRTIASILAVCLGFFGIHRFCVS